VSRITTKRKSRTNFDAWVLQLGLTSRDAADLLEMHLSRIEELRAGRRYGAHPRPAKPSKPMRIAMAALASSMKADAWPD